MSPQLPYFPITFLALIPAFFALRHALSHVDRPLKLPKSSERVLILGASSGLGRSVALQYAQRGARGIMVVGRRGDQIDQVVEECQKIAGNSKTNVIGFAGDFSSIDDMIRIRELLKSGSFVCALARVYLQRLKRANSEWGGVDTVIVAAGVSALMPLMVVAGLEEDATAAHDAKKDGIQHAVDAAGAALKANYYGPLVSAISLVRFRYDLPHHLISRHSKDSPA